jgi:mannose/cellobiose epimerase-like protein (N-acyl-D-glucosamine 2-epimerase family)
MSTIPNFRSPAVLLDHARQTMRFYHPRAIDPAGGMYHYFKDDGTVYDTQHRHLVSSTRFVFTYAMAYRQFQDPAYLDGLRHALRFVRDVHRAPDGSGYAWMLDGRHIEDGTQHAYGLAFVLLAYSHATMAGLDEARAWIGETFDLMERRFWQADAGLYADEASQDWSMLSGYRGQNANMHACEALLAAWQATSERRYLERAYTVAQNITQRQAQRCGGLIWEHYDAQWQPDWKFNLDDPENLFRPWGYQPGHFTEWAKLLLQLEARGGALGLDMGWLLPTAERLFTVAVEKGWDPEFGGIC